MARNYPRNTFRNSIRRWREYRGLTQDRLIARLEELEVPTSKGSLSRIENGMQNYDAELLKGLAEALQCEEADLVMRDPPSKDQMELWSVIRGMQPDQQAQALRLIKALIDKAA